ncbi:MAG: hypothetical protein MEQ84_15420, partial [Mesorhizobium sp.]|nr:hypothetical protein [Mesorhizobium sp.]
MPNARIRTTEDDEMDIPAPLRAAIESVTHGHAMAGIASAGSRLSARYRAEILDGHMHIASD